LASQPSATELLGGCPGQAGGNGQTMGKGGKGGDGGGVVALVANAIDIEGHVNAAGGAGQGGAQGQSGGGGGGAGGRIVLDAPVDVSLGAKAALWATGAGGGQRGSTSS